jgi:O-antigen/teichoic acid export membrane protein
LAGLYNAAVNVAQIPYFGVVAITFVAFPLISASTFGHDQERTRRYVQASFRYGALIAVGCAAGIAGSAEGLMRLLFPAGYADASAALALLVVGYALLALVAIGSTILNAAGKPLLSFAAVTVATAIASAVIVLAIEPHGLVGAAAGTVAGAASGLLLTLGFLWRATAVGPALLSTLRIAGAGIVTAALGLLLPVPGKLLALPMLVGLGLLYLVLLVIGRELGRADLDVLAALAGRKRS